MDKGGMLAADKDHMELVPSCVKDLVCTTGAGDSTMAAIIWSIFNGNDDIVAATEAANAAAALTIGVVETINPNMSEDALRNTIAANYR